MKLSCRGHDHALPFAYDLFRVTYLIWIQACTCVNMHTEDRKHLWLFIVAALRSAIVEVASTPLSLLRWRTIFFTFTMFTGDPLHSRAACAQPCNVNTHSRAHWSPGARLCEQWGHGCVNNGARLCASARLCRGSPVMFTTNYTVPWTITVENVAISEMCYAIQLRLTGQVK